MIDIEALPWAFCCVSLAAKEEHRRITFPDQTAHAAALSDAGPEQAEHW
jgi:hypothetical protein